MPERPAPPPWGALIMTALAREGLSVREAARRAGLSEGRWRQITAGYQIVSPGVYAEVHGPAATIARMASVVGVTPEQLTEAGRDDAAQMLAAQGRSDIDEILERVRELDVGQARELLERIAGQLGITMPSDLGTEDE
jgi:Helix-turn-helix domain